MADNYDQLALRWVKEEVDTTLEQAKQSLEAYVADPDDITRLQTCATCLHQVRGTLQILEFYGAALLSEEMEHLTSALLKEKVAHKDDAYEVLMRAILQLPTYMERVSSGQQDAPLVLLPLLNDLRAARGENLLTESAIFTPNLDIELPKREGQQSVELSEEQLLNKAKKLRHHYQKALLAIFRNVNTSQAIEHIKKVVNYMATLTSDQPAYKLWFVGEAFIDLVMEEQSQGSATVRALLGQLDREIKRVAEVGQAALTEVNHNELIKNLLYQVAQTSCTAESVQKVKVEFGLEDSLPKQEDLEEQRSHMSGPDTQVIKTVVVALQDELASIKDNLDIFVRNQSGEADLLEEVVPALRRVADTLAMLGLGAPRDVIKQQVDLLNKALNAHEKVDDGIVMEVAGALLFVEATLSGLSSLDNDTPAAIGAGEEGEMSPAIQGQSAEFREAKIALIKEARLNLQKAKDAIVEFMASAWNFDLVEAVPRLIAEVSHCLNVTELERPSHALNVCSRFVTNNWIERRVVPEHSDVDALADAITGIEYYLESVEDGGIGPDLVLDAVDESIQQLNDAFAKDEPLVESVAEADEVEQEERLTQSNELDAAISTDEVKPASPVYVADNELVDDEVVEIFIEEAQEELGVINELQPRWCADVNDAESLKTFRRSYHTLKGSGRLVGAVHVGELAWAVENLLNRIIDKTIAPNTSLVKVIEKAREVLPRLIDDFTHRHPHTLDLSPLIECADALSKGNAISDGPITLVEMEALPEDDANQASEFMSSGTITDFTEPSEPTQSPEVDSSSEDEGDDSDDVLLEIFNNEATNHIMTIRHFLEVAKHADPMVPTEALLCALHTLKGSAHMAGITPVAKVAAPLEDYCKNLRIKQSVFEKSSQEILASAVDYLDENLPRWLGSSCEDEDVAPEIAEGIESLLASSTVNASTEDDAHDSETAVKRDPELVSIFLSEANDILNEAEGSLEQLKEAPMETEVWRALQNEYHILKRGATMAALDEIVELADVAERLFKKIESTVESTRPEFFAIADAIQQQLYAMLDMVAAAQDMPSHQDVLEEAEGYLQKLAAKASQPPSAAKEPALEFDNDVSDVTEVDEVDTSEVGVENKEEPLAAIEASSDDGQEMTVELGDIDDELLEIFLEESEQLLDESQGLVADIIAGSTDKDVIASLQRNLHTIKGSARLTGITPVADIAHELEDVYEALTLGTLTMTPDIAGAIEVCHDQLSMMIDECKIHQVCPADISCIDGLKAAVRGEASYAAQPVVEEVLVEEVPVEEVPVEEVPVEVEPSEAVSDVPPQPETIAEGETQASSGGVQLAYSTFEVGDDVDDEILEIFLEEAEEVFDNAGELVESWRDNNKDLSVVKELQRHLHTIKGSSRLSGLMPVGDLAHALEDIYEAIGQGRTDVTEPLINAILYAQDELVRMIDQIKSDSRCEYSEALVSILREEPLSLLDISSEAATEEAGVGDVTIEPVVEDVADESSEVVEQPEPKVVEPDYEVTEVSEQVDIPEEAPEPELAVEFKVEALALDEATEEILQVYGTEARDLIDTIGETIQQLSVDTANSETLGNLMRHLHTLKGGARLANLGAMAVMTHGLENLLISFVGNKKPVSDSVLEIADEVNEELSELLDLAEEKRAQRWNSGLLAKLEVDKSAARSEGEVAELTDDAQIERVVKMAFDFDDAEVEAEKSRKQSQEFIRVKADLLENLVNLAGETSIGRARMEQQVNRIGFSLNDMSATIERLRELLRRMEIELESQIISSHRQEMVDDEYEDFDPLEMDRYSQLHQLSRSLSESANDLLSIRETLSNANGDSETLLLQQARVNTELQEGLMRARMVPFSSIVPRLRRMVRQIGGELKKGVDLAISADGEMDRTVLERLVAPLEHMIRNAIDHGLEDTPDRKKVGKPAKGHVGLKLFREGGDIVVLLTDDGKGLNLEAIRKKAIERGLINKSSNLTEKELYHMIFESGFSTAQAVTQISGRGVGMDVVHSEIKQLGGTIDIDSEQGKGTTFTIRLPFTVSVNHALLIKSLEDVYAVPLTNIAGIVRLHPAELEAYYQTNNPTLNYAGIDYKLVYLGSMVGDGAKMDFDKLKKPIPVLLMHGADHPVAVYADDVLGSREITVKSVGAQLSTVTGLSGATILGDGSIVLILDLAAMLRRADAIGDDESESEEVVAVEEHIPLVMVVDDSITVRKVTTRLLERHNYRVIAAKDGVDAVNLLHENTPDVMLLDIEMPRMDGFELASFVRHDERLKDTPIIMITSRTGEKHRDRATTIGVNHYMGKPFHEVELLERIQEFTN